MQCVGQTSRFLNSRFTEHYRRNKKPRKIDKLFFIDILNSLIILLVIFLFNMLKIFYMMIIILKDIGIFSDMN